MKNNRNAVIFDFLRTIYDPENNILIESAENILKYTNKKYDCFLVSHKEGERENILDILGVKNFFKETYFVNKKTTGLFKEIGSFYNHVYVIGDRIEGEIMIGNKLGYTTIWFKNGKFSTREPLNDTEYPKHTIFCLNEILTIL